VASHPDVLLFIDLLNEQEALMMSPKRMRLSASPTAAWSGTTGPLKKLVGSHPNVWLFI
jgi:hypothetical protein